MIGMNANTGRWISGIDHLVQSIGDVLMTPIGLRIERRPYGCEVTELIDQPLNATNRLRIYAASAHALMTWEPRIILTAMQLEIAADGTSTMVMNASAGSGELQLFVPIRNV
jgi:phage baseplate assembly protein W